AMHEPFHPMRIESRRDLIVSAPDRLVFTSDGETFETVFLKDIEQHIPPKQETPTVKSVSGERND
ncbi:hypothetical protein KBB27_04410, partial [Patescibacteria group bacterium]|nr:hypothetical protein [Patescibacteria group bacterium]